MQEDSENVGKNVHESSRGRKKLNWRKNHLESKKINK